MPAVLNLDKKIEAVVLIFFNFKCFLFLKYFPSGCFFRNIFYKITIFRKLNVITLPEMYKAIDVEFSQNTAST